MLPVGGCLLERNMVGSGGDARCAFCGRIENLLHLFVKCDLIQEILSNISKILKFELKGFECHIINKYSEKLPFKQICIISAVRESIWYYRNIIKFHSQEINIEKMQIQNGIIKNLENIKNFICYRYGYNIY